MKRLAGVLVVVLLGAAGVGKVSAGVQVVKVLDDSYSQGWRLYLDSSYSNNPANVEGDLAEGIGTPPLGTGSVRMKLAGNPSYSEDAVMVRTNVLGGKAISEITTLSYSAYHTYEGLLTPRYMPAFIYFAVDFNGDGVRDDLLFSNTAYNGRLDNVWQTFDLTSAEAKWYFLSNGEGCWDLWPNIVASRPNAKVLGDVRLVIGYGTDGTGEVWIDNVSIGVNHNEPTVYDFEPAKVPGDANGDGKVDVSDLGILAAHYGATAGGTWPTGDFNDDGKVDVGDLGILAAHYGTGSGSVLDFAKDAQAMGLAVEAKEDTPAISTLGCGSAGLPLIAGVLLAGLMLVKLEE